MQSCLESGSQPNKFVRTILFYRLMTCRAAGPAVGLYSRATQRNSK